MKPILCLSSLLAFATASPFTVINSRPLTERDLDSRTGCPKSFSGSNFEPPSLIVPISAANPTKAFGASDYGIFTPNDISSIFNFEIPTSRAGQNCTLEFLFPSNSQEQLTTSSYTYLGGGTFSFTGFAPGSGAECGTTHATQPPPGPYPPFPPIHMEPGNAYVIDIGPCIPGLVAGKTSTNDTTFIHKQDDKSCPIGVWVEYSG